MRVPTERLDLLADEIRAKTEGGSEIVISIGGVLAHQALKESHGLDSQTMGAALMDAAVRLQVLLAHADFRLTGQAIVSILASAGQQLYNRTPPNEQALAFMAEGKADPAQPGDSTRQEEA
jgi:hypothetical protein